MGKWTNDSGYGIAVRLGRVALKAQTLIVAQRARALKSMISAHTKELLAHPRGRRKLAEARTQLAKLDKLILTEDTDDKPVG